MLGHTKIPLFIGSMEDKAQYTAAFESYNAWKPVNNILVCNFVNKSKWACISHTPPGWL